VTALATLLFTASALAVAHVIAATVVPALPRIVALLRGEG